VSVIEVTKGGEVAQRSDGGDEGVGNVEDLQVGEMGEGCEVVDPGPGEVEDAELGEGFEAREVVPGAAVTTRASEGEGLEVGEAGPEVASAGGRKGVGGVVDAGFGKVEAEVFVEPADAEVQSGEVGEVPKLVRPFGEAEVAEVEGAGAVLLFPDDAGLGDGWAWGHGESSHRARK